MAAEQSFQDIKDNFALSINTNFKSAITNDINDVYYLIQQAQSSLTLAAQGREGANQSDKITALDDAFKHFVNLEHTLSSRKQAFDSMKERIHTGEQITDPVRYYEDLQRTMSGESGNDEARINLNQKYLAFRQNIWNVKHPDEMMPTLGTSNDDDDIVMGPTRISLKCPITTSWLDEPVTSNQCKHTYSKKAIYSLFPSRSHAITCPIPGCNRTITRMDLVDDPAMADRVARAKEREEETDTTEFFDV